jgi:polar amino acid transport system substrate-binding protein
MAFLTLLAGEANASCALTVAWEAYGKYTNRDADGALYGVDVDLMRELGRRINCAIAFREMPFKRVLVELPNGTIDISTSVNRTPEREAYARFSAPYYQQTVALFVKADSLGRYRLKSLADAKAEKFRIGVVGGYYYGEEFEALRRKPGFDAMVEEASDHAANLRKLMEGRIQGVLSDGAEVIQDEARKAGYGGLVAPYPISLPKPGVHLMFSRKSVSADTVARIDEALAAMRDDGSLLAIMNRYGS